MPQVDFNFAKHADPFDARATTTSEWVPQYFVVSSDLAAVNDRAAIAVIEVLEAATTEWRPGRFENAIAVSTTPEQAYVVRYLHRPKLGTDYVEIARQVISFIDELPPMKRKPLIVFDGASMGASFLDFARKAPQLKQAIGIVATSGQTSTTTGLSWTCSKAYMVGILRLALSQKRLQVANFFDREVLAEELASFQAKLSSNGRATFSGGDGDAVDDTVAALYMGLTAAKHRAAPTRVQSLMTLESVVLN